MTPDNKLTPGSPAWHRRKRQLLAEEQGQPWCWWYLSFADDDNGGFLGAVIVKAPGFIHAAEKATDLGINPGGEVKGNHLVPGAPDPPAHMINRLVSYKELEQEYGEMMPWGSGQT